jgi:hypothetical protein
MGTVLWLAAGIALLLAGGVWCARTAWRMRVRRAPVLQRGQVVQGREPALPPRDDLAALTDRFRSDSLITATKFLDAAALEKLRQEAADNLPRVVRSYVPTHKQGGTVSYENIHLHAPSCLALYHSPVMHRWISEIIGEPVSCTADHDQSACSLLYYTQPGDYINWHRDPNFYAGRQFTVLLMLVNKAASGGVSAGTLMRKHRDGRQERIELEENALVLFEGPRILHKVSPTASGDTRIALSMTFNTNPRIGLVAELARRVKDTAFFGMKALFD